MRLKYPYKKQMKTNYKIQFQTDTILNDNIEKSFN